MVLNRQSAKLDLFIADTHNDPETVRDPNRFPFANPFEFASCGFVLFTRILAFPNGLVSFNSANVPVPCDRHLLAPYTGQATIFEAWMQVRLIPWGCNAMALSRRCRRSFGTATRHQGFTGAAEGLNILQAAVSQQVGLLEGHAEKRLFNCLVRREALTVSKRRLYLIVAGGLALLEQSFADDRKSSASTVEVSCSTGCP